MPRIRTIKPEFFRSKLLAGCSPRARLTFIGLWMLADDEGRYEYEPELLKADLWPWEADVTAKEADACVLELEARGRVCMYQHAGKTYLHVVNWHEHQKISHPSSSRLPACHRETHGDPPEPSGGFQSTPEESGALRPDLGPRKGNREREEPNPIVEQARPLAVIPGGFSDDPADILDVWDTWKQSTGHQRADFSPIRRKAIVKALDAYPLQDVLDAVQGHVNDPWPERPQHNDITQLLHMGTQRKPLNVLEKMRDLFRDGPPVVMDRRTAEMVNNARGVRAWAEQMEGGRRNGSDGTQRMGTSRPAPQRQLPGPAD